MIGKFVEYPFDTIKVRLQTQPLDHPYFSGPWDCFKTTMKQEGLKGLFTVSVYSYHQLNARVHLSCNTGNVISLGGVYGGECSFIRWI